MLKENKGITLISLVITIIVLLILAGISIGTLTGDNGIINKAKEARLQSDFGSVKEGTSLAVTEYNMEKYTENQQKPFLEWLQEKGYIDENNTVNTQNLLGQTLSTGNGEVTGTTDVYKIQDQSENQEIATTTKVAIENTEEKTFELSYYDEKGSKKELATFTLEETSELQETDPNLFEVNDDGIITLKDWRSYYEGVQEWTIENVIVPSEINGKKATEISYYFFTTTKRKESVNFPKVKKVVISEGIEKTADGSDHGPTGSFVSCPNLEELILPDSLKDIGDYTFHGCEKLSKINLPNGLTRIGREAFTNCNSITRLEISQSVETVGWKAFGGWTENQTIKVPFKEGEPAPEGWDEEWNLECNAKIEYAE